MTSLSTPSTPTTLRTRSVRAASATAVAASGYALEGVIVIAQRLGWNGSVSDHLLDAAYAIAMFATAYALTSLVRFLRLDAGAARRWTLVGRITAQAGLLAMGVESAVAAVRRVDALGVLFAVGILASLLGLLTLAVAGLRRPAVRWPAILPLVGMVVAAAGGGVGASLLTAVIWLLLGRVELRGAPRGM